MRAYIKPIILSCVSAVVGAAVMFLCFAAELSKAVEFVADGKKVLCIRTE